MSFSFTLQERSNLVMDIPIMAWISWVFLFIIFPIVLIRVGWTIGKRLEAQHPNYPWLRWVGLGFGLVIAIGLIVVAIWLDGRGMI
jgi:hypothetical protein